MQPLIIYQAYRDSLSDELVVVEETAQNRFLTSIVCGNYPLDYVSKHEGEFETAEAAAEAAEAVCSRSMHPRQLLQEL
jgi:hypothetical protein